MKWHTKLILAIGLMTFATGAMAGTVVAGYFFAAGTVAYAVTALVVNYALSSLLAPDAPEPPADAGVKTQFPTDPNNKLPVVYGEKNVAGQVTFLDITEDNQTMYFIVSLAEGPIESIDKVFWGDHTLTFASALSGTVQNVTNATNRMAESDDFLNSGRMKVAVFPEGGRCIPMEDKSSIWEADHTNRTMPNVAYVYIELTYDREKRVTGLSKNLQFQVKGKKVRTINVDGSLSTLKTYSNNPAECQVDYLLSDVYGPGVKQTDLDLDSFYSHKTYCDTLVSYVGADSVSANAKRFTVNGVIHTTRDCDQIIFDLMIGNSANITWTYNQFGVNTNKAKSSVYSFSEKNILGSIDIDRQGFDQKLNELTVEYEGVQSFENAEQIIKVVPTSRQNQGEPPLTKTLTLPFTNNNMEADRIANIELEGSRQDIVVGFTATIAALGMESGDVIDITHATPDWSAKKFRVISLEEAVQTDGLIVLKVYATEYADEVYTGQTIQEVDPAPNTNFPSPYATPVLSNLVVSEDTGVDTANFVVTWDNSNSPLTNDYTIKYRFNGQTSATPAEFSTTGRRFEINGLEASSIYYIEVSGRTVNGVEIPSISTTGTTGTTRVVGAAGADSIEVDIVTNNGSLFKGSVTSSQATADVSIGGELQSDSDHNTFKYKWQHLGKTICVDTNRNIIDDGSGNPLVSATGLTCGTGVPADSNLSTDTLGSTLRTVVVGTEDAMNVTYIQCFVSNIPD